MRLRLTFVRRETFHSVYRDNDKRQVYLPHGHLTKYDFTDEIIAGLWQRFEPDYYYGKRNDFLTHLEEKLADPDLVDDVVFCARCEVPSTGDDTNSLANGDQVCEECVSHYWKCEQCEELHSNTTTTLSDVEICSECLDRSWYYCDDCEGYHSEGGEHSHSGCDCEVPTLSVLFGNLKQDERTTVSLPAGVVSDEGLYAIQRHILKVSYTADNTTRREDGFTEQTLLCRVSGIVHEMDQNWTTREGNFTKRFSRQAWKQYAYKVSPEIVTAVGNIGRDHSKGSDFQVELTRDLNLPAYEFANAESCWWGSYSESRCTLKTNGGFGLRSFGEYGVDGRAWVLPLREVDGELVPTFDASGADAHIVFNQYGALKGYSAVRIIAHLAGRTYRKIDFSGGLMYVNGESGYLVGSEDLLERHAGGVSLDLAEHASLYRRESERALVAA